LCFAEKVDRRYSVRRGLLEACIMRSKLLAFVLGCGVAVAAMTPTLACQYVTDASAAGAPQQTAQAQSPDANTQQ
jgi:hypothetical protein